MDPATPVRIRPGLNGMVYMKDGIAFVFMLIILGLGIYLFLYNPNFITYSKNHIETGNNTIFLNKSGLFNFYNKTKNMNESFFINWIKYNKSTNVSNILNLSTNNITEKATYLWHKINSLKNTTGIKTNSSKIYNVLNAAFENLTNSSKN